MRYVNRRWNSDPSRFSVEQLMKSVPKAFARVARRRAASGGREVEKKDFLLAYREPNGDVNFQAVLAALSALAKLKDADLTSADKVSARIELEREAEAAQRALKLEDRTEFGSRGSNLELPDLADLVPDFEASEDSEVFSTVPQTPTAEAGGSFMPERAVNEFLNRARESGVFFNGGILGDPSFRTQMLDLASTSDGANMMEHANATLRELTLGASASAKKPDLKNGVVENDFRALPDFMALGIDRPAGPATQDELRYALGQTKNDGTSVGPDDFFSVGALLANSDIIPQFMSYIPPLELARLGVILETRSKKSDMDHSRCVQSGYFTIVNPKMGTDPKSKMHVDHPMLGRSEYTALTARLIYPLAEFDNEQKAAIEMARRGRLQNLSIAFGYGGVACALCAEQEVKKVIVSNGSVVGFTLDPESNPELCRDRTEEDYFYRVPAVLRTPADTEGNYVYRDVWVLNATDDGNVQIDPIPQEVFDLRVGTTFMVSMDRYFYFFGGGFTYCRLHGLNGNHLRDGRRTTGMFVNMKAFINAAHVDAGAINDARIVLDPRVNY